MSPLSIWRALPVDQPMVVRWWYEPAAMLPRGAARRREWLRLQWAIVDSWIDSRKAARRPDPPADAVPDAVAGPTAGV